MKFVLYDISEITALPDSFKPVYMLRDITNDLSVTITGDESLDSVLHSMDNTEVRVTSAEAIAINGEYWGKFETIVDAYKLVDFRRTLD